MEKARVSEIRRHTCHAQRPPRTVDQCINPAQTRSCSRGAVHTGGKDFVSQGNALADCTAKEAAYGTIGETHVLSVEHTAVTTPTPDQPYTETANYI